MPCQLLSCCVVSLRWLFRPLHIYHIGTSIIHSCGHIDGYTQKNYIGYKDICYIGYTDVAINACYTNYLIPLYLHVSVSTCKDEVPVQTIRAYG
jgi:hypothetical protein